MAMPTDGSRTSMIARIAEQPLLVGIHSEELFTSCLTEMQAHPKFDDALAVSDDGMLRDDFWDDDDEFMSWLRPYDVRDGALVIPVQGVLLNRMSVKFGSFATGYQYIAKAIERGLADPEVDRIVYNVDSPGGMVAGNFELVEMIADAAQQKPSAAVANDLAFSAAYNIAAAAGDITMTRSGGVGSVGVLTGHVDYSERMEKMGVRVTLIHAGKHKVDGNPYEKLPDDVKARIQARIDRLYGEFVGYVAQNRGMEEAAVRATEALTYDASEAIEVGFADRIGTLEDQLARDVAEPESELMTTKPNTQPDNGATITQAQLDQATTDAKATGHNEGVTAERARITGILNSEEAKTRPAAARMAVNAGMSIDDAKASLADMPEERAAAPKEPEGQTQNDQQQPQGNAPVGTQPTPFSQQMTGTGVGAEPTGQGEGGEGEQADASASILGALSMASGRDYTKKKSA